MTERHWNITQQMAPYMLRNRVGDVIIRAVDQTVLGSPLLELQTSRYLCRQQAELLRNWLSDWLGHHRGVEREPEVSATTHRNSSVTTIS
jgi:hypothetical protein